MTVVLSFKRKKLVFGAVIALITALMVNMVFYYGLFDELELKTFDLRERYFSSSRHPADEIAVILIDEASLRSMNPVVGRWPWPRSLHADVIDFLALSGAKAVLFDILFTENERIPGEPPGTSGPNDIKLAEATEASGNVYNAAQFVIDEEDEYNKDLLNKPIPEDFINSFSVKRITGVVSKQYNNYYLPIPELYRVSKGIGIVEFTPDSDGIYRRTKLFRPYQDSFFPVLSTAPLLDIMKPESIRQEEDRLVLSGVQEGNHAGLPLQKTSHVSRLTPDVSIPLQKDGSYLIKMYGDFKPYSMSGVLASIQKIKMGELEGLPVSPDDFKDKVVFIGGSAVGIEDLKPTSLGSNTPGVYLHASVYSNIIQGSFLRYTGSLMTFLSILVLSITVTFAILWSRNIIYYQLGVPFLLAFVYISASFWWFRHNIVFDIVAPTISIVISWMGSFAFLSITEGKDKRKIKKMLSQYVSPSILSMLIDKSPEDVLKAEVGTRERLTILFSDIRGFTSISEQYEAEKVVDILNGYLSGMVDVIFEHEGTLDKFIGDAIMAFWGAPIRVNDHGMRAVETAIDMMRQLEVINEGLKAKGMSPLSIGVGINTGDVILGNIGSEKKLDYTVIGDNVNLASRMEGLTKEYGCPILITESTYKEVQDMILCRVVDIVRVKGKTKGIKIFEPLSAKKGGEGLFEKVISLSEEGFDYYLGRDWERAKEKYSELLLVKPDDKVGRIFIERCEEHKVDEEPEDWDGVYTMMKK